MRESVIDHDHIKGSAELRFHRVSAEDGHLVVDLHVVVEQGVNMSAISANLVSSVKFLLGRIAELEDVDVRVHIEGMRTSR